MRGRRAHAYLRLRAQGLVEALEHLDDFTTFAALVSDLLAANPDL